MIDNPTDKIDLVYWYSPYHVIFPGNNDRILIYNRMWLAAMGMLETLEILGVEAIVGEYNG